MNGRAVMSESCIILGVKRDEANKGEDAEDKGGIMLSIQGTRRPTNMLTRPSAAIK